ncbi:MAG: SulP family inorganic anion transporter [Hyphomicrobiaceae bacterium]
MDKTSKGQKEPAPDTGLRRIGAEVARQGAASGALLRAQIRRAAEHRHAQATRTWLAAYRSSFAPDLVAGLVGALVTIAYCVSFSALIFQGQLQGGLSLGLWALLVGAAVTGIVIAAATTLPPANAGPDNPSVAVMSVLAVAVATPILAQGGSAEAAVTHALLAISLATLVTGLVLFALGHFRLAQLVRFIPYPVIAGFLAASGWLLVTGAIEIVTGRDFDLLHLSGSITAGDLPRLAIGFAFAAAVFWLRHTTGSAFVLPVLFFGLALVLGLALWHLGLMTATSGWYVAGSSELRAWVPVRAALSGAIDWGALAHGGVEMLSVAGVTVLGLLLDVSGLEVARARAADLDAEFRINGIANIAAAPLGGLSGSVSMNSSRLLEETGSRSRLSGLFSAVAIGLVVLTGIDLPGLVPAPVLAGLLIYLGALVLVETVLRPPAQQSWTERALALAIMVAIVQFGYLQGVMLGFIGACLTFALSYARIGVIRRHLTRAEFASDVDRAPDARRLLEREGGSIHIFWLSGYIFFGSSNGVFERIRRAVDTDTGRDARFVVLDFASVSGLDTSAILSLVKLRNLCQERGLTLAFAELSLTMLAALEHAGVLGAGQRHRAFPNRNEALAWCEDRVLEASPLAAEAALPDAFERWLAAEFGPDAGGRLVATYFVRTGIEADTVLYRQGEPSDTIDLVAAGTIAITVTDIAGGSRRVRRMMGHTVVGEMGFFRGTARAASVSAETDAVVYTLTRASYERLVAEQPELGASFHRFIIRVLADRVAFANQEIAALV